MSADPQNLSHPICVTITTQKAGSSTKSTLVNRRIAKFPQNTSFADFFDELTQKLDITDEVCTRIGISIEASALHGDAFEIEKDEILETAKQFGDIKIVKYHVLLKGDTPKPLPETKDAFAILMGSSLKRVDPLPNSNQKNKLHNAVLEDLQQNGPILNSHFSQQDANNSLVKLSDAIWYLDGRQTVIQEAVKARGNLITPIPERFEKYVGFQDWKAWKKRPRMEHSRCNELAESLTSVLQKKVIGWPSSWTDDILTLASTFSTYAQYLKVANEGQQQRQSLLNPVRELSSNATGQYWAPVAADKVHPYLQMLSKKMAEQPDYEPLLITDDHFPKSLNASQKYYYMNRIALAVPVQVLRYDPGGGSSVLHFMYRVPLSLSDNERITKAMQILKTVEPQIPIYHTRAMRKTFQAQVSTLHGLDIKPHVLRHIYRSLTGDASAEVACAPIDERVKVAIETGDPDLVFDLRHLNKGLPGDTFDIFFRELEKLVEEKTAADDRRHGVAHMSDFLSIPDLIREVQKRIPEGSAVPSEATVTYAFAPPNTYSSSSQYYTGRINLKHAVQQRQLRAFHSDAHYCNALFRYLREMAILHRETSLFLSCDDKAKVDFGEPGMALSTGVRGKKSIIPTTSVLGALDHDMEQKGSLTPSVTMMCNIPEDITESFYRGQVAVCLKDSVFQPSNSFRSAVELLHTVRVANSKDHLDTVKNVFMITDGGSEHRVNFDSVKIPLILLFKELNLDMLVAIRTAPGHSYTNPVERVMSIINIGFQNVALHRESSQSDLTVKKCKTLDNLRKHPEIRDDWNQSINPMIRTLEERLKRLALKETPFMVTKPATDTEVDEFVAKSAEIDSSLPRLQKAGKLTKADLVSKASYQHFLRQHCQQGHYMFQIRRCDDATCCSDVPLPENLHWVPNPTPDPLNEGHYKTFEDLYGQDTTEDHIPSRLNDVRKVSAEQQGCKASTLTAQNVREVVRCSDCAKVRCIYADKQLSPRQDRELRSILRKYDYVCGCMITPDVSLLAGMIFTRLELTCQSPIEWPYYGAMKINTQKDTCAHCGSPGGTVEGELKKCFKTVLPICTGCKLKGKESLRRGPLNTAAAKRAAKEIQGKGKKSKRN